MITFFAPETNPARVLAPSLLAVLLGAVTLTVTRALFMDGPQGSTAGLSTAALVTISGVLAAFSAFFVVLFNSGLVWLYGKTLRSENAGFVRTLAVVAFAFGVVLLTQVSVLAVELAATGTVGEASLTTLSRYMGPDTPRFDLVNVLNVAIVAWGARRYLGYGLTSTWILASAMLAIYVLGAALV